MTKEENTLKIQVLNLMKDSFRLGLTPLDSAKRIIKHIENFNFINTPFFNNDRNAHNRFLHARYRKHMKEELRFIGAQEYYINDFLKFFPESERYVS